MNLIFPDNQLENLISLWEHIFTDCLRRWVHFCELNGSMVRLQQRTKREQRTKKMKQSNEYDSRQYILVHEADSQMKTHFLSNFDSYIVYTFE